MSCMSCGSENQTEFASEISVHILGLENVDKPAVMTFPRLLTCIDCGFTEFRMPEDELRLLTKRPASDVEPAG
jgi:predicted nucleic-acid-binding Zn-ribbon protein